MDWLSFCLTSLTDRDCSLGLSFCFNSLTSWAKTLRKCEVDDKKLLCQLNRHLQCRSMKKTDSCVARKTLWAQFQLTSSSNRVSFQPSYLNVGSSNSSRFYRMMPLLACPWRFLLHFLVASRISSQEIMLSWNFNSKTVQLLQVRVRCHGWYLILFSFLLSESRNHCNLSCLVASYHPRPWEKKQVSTNTGPRSAARYRNQFSHQ